METGILELCSALIAIDSINPFRVHEARDDRGELTGDVWIDGNEAGMLDFCERYLQEVGFSTWRQDCGGGRQNLLAEKGQGPRAVLLYGHVDTVEVKPGWTREEALCATRGQREVDGRMQEVLFGLGSNDMKGGLAVLLRAASQARWQGYRLKVALGCDEEFWSLGSEYLVHHSDFLDDVIGILVPEVGESTEEPEPGKVLVTLGRCGRTELIVDVPGTGGHGAEPEEPGRVNAISQAAKIALEIERDSRDMAPFVPFADRSLRAKPSALVTQIQGGAGQLSIPDHAQLVVNRVLVPSETSDSAKQRLEDLLLEMRSSGALQPVVQGGQTRWPEVSIRPRPTPPLQPYLMSVQQPFVRAVLDILQSKAPLQLGMGVSVADENRFGAEAHKPVVVLGPRGEDSHAAYEWVTVESLLHLEQLYISILGQLSILSFDSLTSTMYEETP